MWSMTVACSGKIRSTPTPKLTLRTVTVSRTPPCLRAMHDALESLKAFLVAFLDADVHA